MLKARKFIDKYLEQRKARGLTPGVIKMDMRALTYFINFLKNERKKIDLREVTKKDIEKFVLWVKKKKSQQSKKTICLAYKNKIILTTKAFFYYLAVNEYIMTDISQDIELFLTGKTLPRNIFTKREIKKFFSVINMNNLIGKRNFCLFRLLYHTGLRKSEAEDLIVWNMDFDDGTMLVKGKFKKKKSNPIRRKYITDIRKIFKRDKTISIEK